METNNSPIRDMGQPHSGRISATVVPLLLAIVLFGGIGGRFSEEIYPIANWGMFSQTPSRSTVYTLAIHSLNGKPLAPPPLLRDVPELQAAFKTAKETYRIRAAWTAMESKSPEKIAAERRNLEALFGKNKVTYELLRAECDPIAYLREGRTLSESTFGVFESGKPLDEQDLNARAPRDGAPR